MRAWPLIGSIAILAALAACDSEEPAEPPPVEEPADPEKPDAPEASPEGKAEDDGVLLFAMIHGSPDVSYTGLVVLDARTMTELGRAEFELIGPAIKPLHGYFTGNNFSLRRK